jgi:hypothetical protein
LVPSQVAGSGVDWSAGTAVRPVSPVAVTGASEVEAATCSNVAPSALPAARPAADCAGAAPEDRGAAAVGGLVGSGAAVGAGATVTSDPTVGMAAGATVAGGAAVASGPAVADGAPVASGCAGTVLHAATNVTNSPHANSRHIRARA